MYMEEVNMNSMPIVTAMNVTTFRKDLRKQLESITNDDLTMIITRPDDKNVVVLSEQYYRELLKTINNLNFEIKILKGQLEIERGGGYTLDEVKKIVGME